MRWVFNLYPPYFFSRTHVKYIAPNWQEIIVELSKTFLTRNYVGTTFGGSLYAASDPFFMIMLIKILGMKDYIVWDQAAKIQFIRPARSKITYHFVITDSALADIREKLKTQPKVIPEFIAEGTDQWGEVCVRVEKTIYIRNKSIILPVPLDHRV